MSHLANLISVIKVGIKCHKSEVHFTVCTKLLRNFVKVIYETGLIERYVFLKKTEDKVFILIYLKVGVLKDIKMISKPGRKIYISVYQLKSLMYKNNRKLYIISTSNFGIITSNTAIEKNVCGELICELSHI